MIDGWKGVTDLLFQIDPLQREGVTDDCQRYEIVVANELRRRERRQRIDEQLPSTFELSDGDEV